MNSKLFRIVLVLIESKRTGEGVVGYCKVA